MLEIDGKTVLEHVLRRVQKATLLDYIVLAIPVGDNIPDYGFDVFEGSEDDVLERYYRCAEQYKFDVIVRITSDCPLIPPYEINRVIQEYLNEGVDYATNRPGMPDGYDVEVFSFDALAKAHICATSDYDREHVTNYIKNDPDMKIMTLEPLKLSLDTQTDYQNIRGWHELER